MKKDIIIEIERKNGNVYLPTNSLGIKGENLQGNIIFKFKDEFVDGIAWLETEIDGIKNYIIMDKIEDTYQVEIKSSLLTSDVVYMNLRITEDENAKGIPVFKSKMFYLTVSDTIDSTEEQPEGYDSWIDVANNKILEINSKIEEVDNIDISQEQTETGSKLIVTNKEGISTETTLKDGFNPTAVVEKEGIVSTLTVTDKFGETSVEILDGVGISNIEETPSEEDEGINNIKVMMTDETEYDLTVKNGSQGPEGDPGPEGKPGRDGLINGKNTIDIVGGENIEIEQVDNTLTINAIGGGSIDDVKVNGESVVEDKVANIEVPTSVSQLEDDINIAKSTVNNNFTVAQTINGTLTVNGDIVQNGKSYETHAEKLFTKNDVIITRDGAVGGLAEGEYTGIEAKNYDGKNDGQLVFDANGEARVGDKNDTQPLLTRDELENLQTGQVLVWDGENFRAVGSGDFVKNTDYAKENIAGIVKTRSAQGIQSTSDGYIRTTPASNSDIDARSNYYKPITPNTLDYAVRSVLPLISNTLNNPFVAGTWYKLDTQTQVTINPPESVEDFRMTVIKFTSGTNFSITIGDGIVGDVDYPFTDNSDYLIILLYDGAQWIMSVLEV